MRLSQFKDLARIILALIVMTMSALTSVRAHPPSPDVIKMFPTHLGIFHNDSLSFRPLVTLAKQINLQSTHFAPNAAQFGDSPFLGAEAEYSSTNGDRLLVEILRARSDSSVYSLYTLVAKKMREGESDLKIGAIGTASIVTSRSVAFFKGSTFARVTNEKGNTPEPALALARLLVSTFETGEDDIPVLVKHLPNWEIAQRSAIYAVNVQPLREAISNQPILDQLDFAGGTEAVAANYGQAQLVIVEFGTPQFSVDNDQRITAKIQELRNQQQPVPTAYRRVGNYSVFVFNATDEASANQLIDQVQYQKVVQWLGDDPYLYERLQRYFAQTSAGVLIAVLKSSGLSVVICLSIGGLLGVLLFRHRRAQKAAFYSDAGGSVRLNLDELTRTHDSSRLLEGPKHQTDSNKA